MINAQCGASLMLKMSEVGFIAIGYDTGICVLWIYVARPLFSSKTLRIFNPTEIRRVEGNHQQVMAPRSPQFSNSVS
jgi:hypothetical protein